MAGCRPEYFTLVLTALEAALDPAFNLNTVVTSTGGAALCVIVSGPLAQAIGMNARHNVRGSGNRANATIGRALRLTASNAPGAKTGKLDAASIGHPGKFTLCFAEDPPPAGQHLAPRRALGPGTRLTLIDNGKPRARHRRRGGRRHRGHVASFAVTTGMPGYHSAVVPHPVSSKDDAQLAKFAAARRYVSADPDSPSKYLAVYEFDTDDIDASIKSLYALAAETWPRRRHIDCVAPGRAVTSPVVAFKEIDPQSLKPMEPRKLAHYPAEMPESVRRGFAAS